MEERSGPVLRRPAAVIGPRLRFRLAGPDDAAFILSLRLDPAKNAHLSATSADVEAQRKWLEATAGDRSQIYFIITGEGEKPVGTVRLYDVVGESFSWGSWILSDEAPRSAAVESTLMVYSFGLACGFQAAHFEVRQANEKVWQYHERFGAVRTSSDELHHLYSISRQAIEAALERYRGRIPDGVRIEWE
jgi:hypothetical protein